jgi:hypothetical protein
LVAEVEVSGRVEAAQVVAGRERGEGGQVEGGLVGAGRGKVEVVVEVERD